MIVRAYIKVFIFLLILPAAAAEQFKCVTKSHMVTSDEGYQKSSSQAHMINWDFKVNVSTGDIEGNLAGNTALPNKEVIIVDHGHPGMPVTIVTTRGGIFGYLADLLVIKTWVEKFHKPFDLYISGYGLFSGTCTRF